MNLLVLKIITNSKINYGIKTKRIELILLNTSEAS